MKIELHEDRVVIDRGYRSLQPYADGYRLEDVPAIELDGTIRNVGDFVRYVRRLEKDKAAYRAAAESAGTRAEFLKDDRDEWETLAHGLEDSNLDLEAKLRESEARVETLKSQLDKPDGYAAEGPPPWVESELEMLKRINRNQRRTIEANRTEYKEQMDEYRMIADTLQAEKRRLEAIIRAARQSLNNVL